MRNAIKNRAIENGLIKRVEVKNINGLRIADFRGAGVVEKTIDLPKELWLESDDVQFAYLNKVIGGQKAGYTWHHSEIPGKMELIPFGIHNVYNHNGGRTKGQWADAPR